MTTIKVITATEVPTPIPACAPTDRWFEVADSWDSLVASGLALVDVKITSVEAVGTIAAVAVVVGVLVEVDNLAEDVFEVGELEILKKAEVTDNGKGSPWFEATPAWSQRKNTFEKFKSNSNICGAQSNWGKAPDSVSVAG
jgi:hypothetical protein